MNSAGHMELIEHDGRATETVRPTERPDDNLIYDSKYAAALNLAALPRILGGIAVLLVCTSLGGQLIKALLGYDYLMGLLSFFNVDRERNVPTFFSTVLLLFAAVLLTVITAIAAKQKRPYVGKWGVLAAGFLLMAFDETTGLHERLIAPVRAGLGVERFGVFYFAWVIPGMVLVGVLAIYFVRFLWHLPGPTRRAFLIAGGMYLSGAIGIELLGGRYAEQHGDDDLGYNLLVTVEEAAEMFGVLLFIRALLNWIADTQGEVRLRYE
ncbi:MAG: hypothetical protein KF861_02410 [Planctomycetaceae bacterium]|nr:hypothetical protein [Planctomycetaceae bacterium]